MRRAVWSVVRHTGTQSENVVRELAAPGSSRKWACLGLEMLYPPCDTAVQCVAV
jgi:hypothetical protein